MSFKDDGPLKQTLEEKTAKYTPEGLVNNGFTARGEMWRTKGKIGKEGRRE